MHKTVGAIIKNKKGEILMIDRAYFPFGWACPAGHADEGETTAQTLIREVKEESNLDIKKFKLLFHEYIPWNECVQGVVGHDWYLYEVEDWVGEIAGDKQETKGIGWYSMEDIKNLNLEEIWKYWFEKLKIM